LSTHSQLLGSENNETQLSLLERREQRELVLEGVLDYFRKEERLGKMIQRHFGMVDEANRDNGLYNVFLHKTFGELLKKTFRGRREQVVQEEIYRAVDEHLQRSGFIVSGTATTGATGTLQGRRVPSVDSLDFTPVEDDDTDDEVLVDEPSDIEGANPVATSVQDEKELKMGQKTVLDEADYGWIRQQALYKLVRTALWEASAKYGTRSDGRRGLHLGQGWKTIRPVTMAMPALPESVHGSAVFARGDTQVLCTATLGAPKDGQPLAGT
jgi:hypothetical protein